RGDRHARGRAEIPRRRGRALEGRGAGGAYPPAGLTPVATLIKGGTLLTLDPALGDLERADLLVEGEKIAAIGRGLPAPAGTEVIDAADCIVMPGLVNAHLHTWQLGLRGIGADWVSSRDYHKAIHAGMAKHYGPEDNY